MLDLEGSSIKEIKKIGIREWYKGRSIFVSGGTGFMGKILIEKLLRSCDVEKIFILCRPKRGKNPQTRLQEMENLPVFDLLKKQKPNELKKLVLIEGDMLQENMGLSQNSIDLLKSKVSVVFNVAASLKLEAGLKENVEHNLRGTLRMLELAKDLPKLESFCHLSTAFCHCEMDVLEEKLYEPPANPHDILSAISWMTDEMADLIAPKLFGPHPNSYTYTKRLAEGLMLEYGKHMPIVVCRPSIVIPSLREPMPGWVDSLNGPVGVLVAGAKGVLRSMLCESENTAEVIPVDICINALLFATCKRALERTTEVPTYNISASEKVVVKWGELLELGRKTIEEYPLDPGLWYPGGTIRTNPYSHALIVLLFQTIPAYFIDFIMFLIQQKRFMVRVQKRILLGMQLLQYFTMRQWNFVGKKVLQCPSLLDDEENEIFPTANTEVDVKEFMKDVIIGSRIYCLKEPLKNQPRARIILRIMYYLDITVKIWLMYFVLTTLWSIVTPTAKYFTTFFN